MGRTWAGLGSAAYFCVAPGTVVGIVPWLVTRWSSEDPFTPYWPVRLAGVLLLSAAVAFLAMSFVRFVAEGVGTPAPVAPTRRLVIGGPYRYVRNPMYMAVVTAVVGQALLLGQGSLLWYAAAVAGLQAAFVRFHEEPGLQRSYGDGYDAYRRAVPAWRPRLRPWHGPACQR